MHWVSSWHFEMLECCMMSDVLCAVGEFEVYMFTIGDE